MKIIIKNSTLSFETAKTIELSFKTVKSALYFSNSSVTKFYSVPAGNVKSNQLAVHVVDVHEYRGRTAIITTTDDFDPAQTRAAFLSNLGSLNFDDLSELGNKDGRDFLVDAISKFNVCTSDCVSNTIRIKIPDNANYLAFNSRFDLISSPNVRVIA